MKAFGDFDAEIGRILGDGFDQVGGGEVKDGTGQFEDMFGQFLTNPEEKVKGLLEWSDLFVGLTGDFFNWLLRTDFVKRVGELIESEDRTQDGCKLLVAMLYPYSPMGDVFASKGIGILLKKKLGDVNRDVEVLRDILDGIVHLSHASIKAIGFLGKNGVFGTMVQMLCGYVNNWKEGAIMIGEALCETCELTSSHMLNYVGLGNLIMEDDEDYQILGCHLLYYISDFPGNFTYIIIRKAIAERICNIANDSMGDLMEASVRLMKRVAKIKDFVEEYGESMVLVCDRVSIMSDDLTEVALGVMKEMSNTSEVGCRVINDDRHMEMIGCLMKEGNFQCQRECVMILGNIICKGGRDVQMKMIEGGMGKYLIEGINLMDGNDLVTVINGVERLIKTEMDMGGSEMLLKVMDMRSDIEEISRSNVEVISDAGNRLLRYLS